MSSTQNNENTISSEPITQSKGSFGLVITLVIIVTAFYLLINSMMAGGQAGGAYFMEVDEIAKAQNEGKLKPGRKLRVKGIVKVGTYVNKTGSSEHQFMVQGEHNEVAVYYKGAIPDVFKEGGEVVATGIFDKDQVLVATEVTAKCPSKYEKNGTSEARKRQGLEAPMQEYPSQQQPTQTNPNP
jgi:cytochrome c-type biogenesis protein CcmE